MDIEFADSKYDRLETDSQFDAGLPQAIVTSYRKRLWFIRAAPDERDFYDMKSLHFEKLKGDRQGQHSMRLNSQWRLILEILQASSGKKIRIIEIADYH